MKVLFLSQGKLISDHPGWNDSLIILKREKVISEFLNIPYYGYVEKFGWDLFYTKIVSLCSEFKYDLVYFHYFHKNGVPSPKACIQALKAQSHNPVVITSSGDPWSDNWMRNDFPENIKEASRYADITFSTQMGRAADKMKRWGAQNIVYTPNSMCQVRFEPGKINLHRHNFEHDIVFVGSNNTNRFFNPISQSWYGNKKRQYLVGQLNKRFGKKLGLYGNRWDNSSSLGPIPFNTQQQVFRKGRIVVGANPISTSDYYSSNRLFFEVSSAVPTVELSVPRLDKILRNGDHCYFVADVDELIFKCEELLNSDPELLYKKSNAAAKYIGDRHTQYHRMKFKIDTVKRFVKNGNKLDVKFPFFLNEIDLSDEYNFATR